ncbi:hypothetical protein EJB05_43146, partial [Eragrostis curvula]
MTGFLIFHQDAKEHPLLFSPSVIIGQSTWQGYPRWKLSQMDGEGYDFDAQGCRGTKQEVVSAASLLSTQVPHDCVPLAEAGLHACMYKFHEAMETFAGAYKGPIS